ncbi:MAG: hypothetical protein WC797_01380 [Candidatus Paceibacterota bacterium]|jgi:hypothetical protein
MKKTIIWVLVVLIGGFFAISALGIYYPTLQKWYRGLQVKTMEWQASRNYAKHQEALKNDKEGGTTPEDTFDLFLGRLEANDVDGAAKLYEIDIQDRAKANLAAEMKEKGSLAQSLNFFKTIREKGVKKCRVLGEVEGCVFDYEYVTSDDDWVSVDGSDQKIFVAKETVRTKGTTFIMNNFTEIWKLKSPF